MHTLKFTSIYIYTHACTHTYAYMHIHVCMYAMSSHVFPCSHHADFQGSAKDTPYQQPEQIHIALGQPGVGCRDRCISRRENHLYMVDIPANHVWLPEDLRIGMPYLYIFNLLTLIVGSISWPFTSRGSNAIWSQCGLGIHCFNLFGPVSGKCCAFILEAKESPACNLNPVALSVARKSINTSHIQCPKVAKLLLLIYMVCSCISCVSKFQKPCL